MAVPAIDVLGTRVHMVRTADVLHILEAWIGARDRCRYVIVSNMHSVIEARRDPSFRRVVDEADLFVPDGISVVWAARRRGGAIEERVSGTDLLDAFCAIANAKGYRSFFYGDTPEVLAQAAANLARRFPDLAIAGTYSPPFRPLSLEEDTAIVEMINRAAPDVLWVALGCPKQERWMFEHRDRLRVPVVLGIGAALKFTAGTVKRAPRWVRERHLEWLWRLTREPRAVWRRVLLYGPRFIGGVLVQQRPTERNR